MYNHLMFLIRSFMGVYGPHPAKALLPQDISIPYVLRCRQICIPSVSTSKTKELQTCAVSLSNMSAFRASLRCIGGVYGLCPNTFLGKLITCLKLQRTIGPSTDFFPKVLAFFQRCFTDIAKVFKHNHPSIGLFGILGQGFRSNMHEMFRNGPFAVCQAFQKTPGRPGTYGLNFTPSNPNTFPQQAFV
jgi:hypothetical protein